MTTTFAVNKFSSRPGARLGSCTLSANRRERSDQKEEVERTFRPERIYSRNVPSKLERSMEMVTSVTVVELNSLINPTVSERT